MKLWDQILTLSRRFINRYAFSHIALYGKAYIPAAKDTWTMMKNRGIDALVNDCLIGPVLTMVSHSSLINFLFRTLFRRGIKRSDESHML